MKRIHRKIKKLYRRIAKSMWRLMRLEQDMGPARHALASVVPCAFGRGLSDEARARFRADADKRARRRNGGQ